MTALKALLDIFTVDYVLNKNDKEKSYKRIIREILCKSQKQRFPVDNNKVEQLHSEEELMSKIEDIVNDMGIFMSKKDMECKTIKDTYAFRLFQKQLKNLFKSYREKV